MLSSPDAGPLDPHSAQGNKNKGAGVDWAPFPARVHGAAQAARPVPLVELRVGSVQQRLEAVKFAIELEARRRVAVLAVALTLGGGAGVGGLAG